MLGLFGVLNNNNRGENYEIKNKKKGNIWLLEGKNRAWEKLVI